jgi:DNA polymerase-3 subunit gamma/tau
MAAQALYRKWRSQTFDELVGQEHIVRTLRNAVVEDRVAHAYLFTGPRGVGKTSMARLLAKAVNCSADTTQRPCGECASCRAISEGHAVDVVEMDAASHTSVEDAREIIERVRFRPTSGRYKVYVIDEVHMLSTAAFNALLKTLEEPPEHAIFVLATTEIHKVPATILSRCQRFTFSRHTIAEIVAHITRVAESEQVALEPGVAEAIARAATGSMRDALGTLEQLSAFSGTTITLEQVRGFLGIGSAAEVDALVEALLAQKLPAALQLINHVADQGSDLRQFVRDLVERLRMLMLVVVAGEASMAGLVADEQALLRQWADQADASLLVQWMRLLSNLDYQLRTTPYGQLPLELAIVEALVGQPAPPASTTPAIQPAAPKRSPRTPSPATRAPRPTEERRPAIREAPESAPTASADEATPHDAPSQAAADTRTSATEPVPEALSDADEPPHENEPPAPPAKSNRPPPHRKSRQSNQHTHQNQQEHDYRAAAEAAGHDISVLEQLEEVWPAVVRDVRPRDRNLEAVLKSGVSPVDVEGDTVVLLAPYDFHKKRLDKPDYHRILEDVLSKHLGQRVRMRCVTRLQPEELELDLVSQFREARKDRRVHAAINVFDADLIRIEPLEEEEEEPEA